MPSLSAISHHLPITLRRDLRSAGVVCALLVSGVLSIGALAGTILTGSPIPHGAIGAVSGEIAQFARAGDESAQAAQAPAESAGQSQARVTQPAAMLTVAATRDDQVSAASPERASAPSRQHARHRRSRKPATHAPKSAAPATTPTPAPVAAAATPPAAQTASAATPPATGTSSTSGTGGRSADAAQPAGKRGGTARGRGHQRAVVQASPAPTVATLLQSAADGDRARGRIGGGSARAPERGRPATSERSVKGRDHGYSRRTPGTATPAPSPAPVAPSATPAPVAPAGDARDGGWGHGHGDARDHGHGHGGRWGA